MNMKTILGWLITIFILIFFLCASILFPFPIILKLFFFLCFLFTIIYCSTELGKSLIDFKTKMKLEILQDSLKNKTKK